MRKAKAQLEEDLMPLKEAAEYLYLDESTLRKGLCGTGEFAKIYQGRLVFFIRSQVVQHKQRLIQAAMARERRIEEFISQP
jgi:hypothetical protein